MNSKVEKRNDGVCCRWNSKECSKSGNGGRGKELECSTAPRFVCFEVYNVAVFISNSIAIFLHPYFNLSK